MKSVVANGGSCYFLVICFKMSILFSRRTLNVTHSLPVNRMVPGRQPSGEAGRPAGHSRHRPADESTVFTHPTHSGTKEVGSSLAMKKSRSSHSVDTGNQTSGGMRTRPLTGESLPILFSLFYESDQHRYLPGRREPLSVFASVL